MLQVAGGKWQVATGECPPARAKGLCVVSFHPFMPHSHTKLFRLHCNCELLLWVGGDGNGDSPRSTVPSFSPLAHLFYVNCFYGNTLHLYLWPAGPAPFTSN